MKPSSSHPRRAHPVTTAARRSGSALVMTLVTVIALAGMAYALTILSMGTFTDQQRRQDQVVLLASAESALNEGLDWMGRGNTPVNGGALQTLPVFPVSSGLYNPTPPYTGPTYIPNRVLTYALPAMGTNPANRAGYRNNCAVTVEIIKLRDTVGGAANWPDGNEKFQVYATATAGNLTNSANTYRRMRVDAIVSTSHLSDIFTGAVYGRNGYAWKGAATSDGWSGTNATGTPVPYPGMGVTNSGDLSSGGTVTVQKPSNVLGTVHSNVNEALPVLNYNPVPTATSGSVGDVTLTGPTSVHYTSTNGAIHVNGTGTVDIYVDADVNVSALDFPSGTANVVIHQGNYGASSGFSLNGGGIGDKADPRRLVFMSNYTGTMTLNGNASFSGVFFAPYATIKCNGTFDFFGGIIALGFNSAQVNGTFNFHYDQLLGNFQLPLTPRLTATGWWPHTLVVGQP